MNKKVAVVTLGCKLNFAESSAIAREFTAKGYEEVAPSQDADIYVVNTCSVTEHSDKKCRNIIRKYHRLHPDALIVATGCYAQLKPKEVSEIEGVALTVGQENKGEIFSLTSELLNKNDEQKHYVSANISSTDILKTSSVFPAYSCGERTRSFLKIQDGCDNFCTYCTVPYARGRSRSIAPDLLVKQAETLASDGIKEIVLTGVNIGDYGKKFENGSGSVCCKNSFLELLKRLNYVSGIERYRISSIEPDLLNDDIIDWISSGTKFQNHFHIPLQSGCDSVLSRMKRHYDTKMFKNKIEYVREKMGDVFFGIDVIAGFPGETDSEFDETFRFLSEEIKPAFLHIFPYSRRPGTPAAAVKEQVAESVKTKRVECLEALCSKLHNEYCSRFKGTTQKVLFESAEKNGLMSGYTGNYIRVERPYDASLIGSISEVVIS